MLAIERGARDKDVEIMSGWGSTLTPFFQSLFNEVFTAGQTLENECKNQRKSLVTVTGSYPVFIPRRMTR